MENEKINSWEDLQKNIKKIAVYLNKDENLRIAAASNPFYALEEMGYEIDPAIKSTIEDKMRFKVNEVEKLAALREDIFKYAGKIFDIRSKTELSALLFEELKLVAYDENGCPLSPYFNSGKTLQNMVSQLSEYKGLHPIILPLIEFWKIDNSVAGLSDKVSYQLIREGKHPVNSRIKLSIRLKTHKT